MQLLATVGKKCEIRVFAAFMPCFTIYHLQTNPDDCLKLVVLVVLDILKHSLTDSSDGHRAKIHK